MTIIGRTLKEARENSGYTQLELGRKVGASAQYISNIERGLCVMEPKKMLLAGRALKISKSTLVESALQDYKFQLLRKMK